MRTFRFKFWNEVLPYYLLAMIICGAVVWYTRSQAMMWITVAACVYGIYNTAWTYKRPAKKKYTDTVKPVELLLTEGQSASSNIKN